MTPPLSVQQIIWRELTANEIEAIAVAKGSARIAVEYLWPLAAAFAIKECERANHVCHGSIFQSEFAKDISMMMHTTLRRVLAEQWASRDVGRFNDAA